MVLPQNILVPCQQSLAFFLQENPPLLLKDLQVLWQVLFFVVGMGTVEDGVGALFPGLLVLCLLERSLVLFLLLGTRSFVVQLSAYCETEMDLSDTQFCGAVAPVPSGAETEPNGAQAHGALSAAFETDLENAQFSGAGASPLRFETEFEGAQIVDLVASPSGFETERKDVQFFEAEATSTATSGLVVASAGPLCSVDLAKVTQVTLVVVDGKDELLWVLARASVLRRV